jgi:RimJ/RimL family protein N-acetyltransferase
VNVRVLLGPDAAAYRRVRLEGLRDSPTAFANHYEDECDDDLESVAARLEPTPDRVVLGALDEASLVGVVGLRREVRHNLRHKALLLGMYVTPASRKKGVGQALLQHALTHAAQMPGLRQVNLCVNAASESAIAMYRAAGFEQFGYERAFLVVDGMPQDLIHMVRVLPRNRHVVPDG